MPRTRLKGRTVHNSRCGSLFPLALSQVHGAAPPPGVLLLLQDYSKYCLKVETPSRWEVAAQNVCATHYIGRQVGVDENMYIRRYSGAPRCCGSRRGVVGQAAIIIGTHYGTVPVRAPNLAGR